MERHQVGERPRQPEVGEGWRIRGNGAKHRVEPALLLEGVATKAADPRDRVGEVELLVLLEQRALLLAEQTVDQLLGKARVEHPRGSCR